MTSLVRLDGSMGEGGGQVLRTALALSLTTRRAVEVTKIRAGRQKPGLMRQHLTAVQAAAAVGSAHVSGAEIGSRELRFEPGAIRSGPFEFSVGTAGSATLVLQTILPALLTAGGPSTVRLRGGTHNPMAPPFDFLVKAFLPLLGRMGARVEADLVCPGFYPAGGGELIVTVAPVARLRPFELLARGEIRRHHAKAVVSKLSREIATRELSIVSRLLGWEAKCLETVSVDSAGPGNVLTLELQSDQVTEVFTGFGEKGVSAEAVAEETVRAVRRYLVAGVPVGEHLADQLLLPMALAGSGAFRTTPLSRHATTNVQVIQAFLPVRFDVEADEKGNCVVRTGDETSSSRRR
jgi:RNA 3'-terminal phosphate cyclase (ATP)